MELILDDLRIRDDARGQGKAPTLNTTLGTRAHCTLVPTTTKDNRHPSQARNWNREYVRVEIETLYDLRP
jgi:hypothetical protein